MANAAGESRDPPCDEPESETEAEPGESSEAESEWQAVPWKQPAIEPDENEENEQPVPKRRAVVRPLPLSPVRIPLFPFNSNRAGPSGLRPQAESTISRVRSVRRIDSSSDEEEAEAGSANMVIKQETAHRRETRHKMRHEARQFVETMAVVESEADSVQQLESANESTASDDSFIVVDNVSD
jgi:hypothetical protein